MVRVAAACAALVLLGGCGDAKRPPAGIVRARVGAAPALAQDGPRLLVGARATGRITVLGGRGTPTPYPPLAVSTAGQRGLLSLAARGGHVYAAWTTPQRRLVVGELRAGRAPRLVWNGPQTATLANGGHLVVAPDGRLVIGIGDRQRGHQRGRVLALDPSRRPNQEPTVLSTGWNNPYALTYTPAGELWVADNSPGRAPERLARGDRGRPTEVTDLPVKTAPSGLVAIDDDTLAVCGFVSGRLDRYVRRGRTWHADGTLSGRCRYGATRTTAGRIAVAGDDAVREVAP